ncbi:MAG: B12-binding domain-containing radical SAM protein, partial [Senegalia sp. (in: firmicutes)]
KDLKFLIDSKVKQVKFVDRTFNTDKEYSMEIMNYIIDNNPENINFHFEVTAHVLDEELLSFVKDIPEGMFQFEIGVQTTNEKTIEAIGRTSIL